VCINLHFRNFAQGRTLFVAQPKGLPPDSEISPGSRGMVIDTYLYIWKAKSCKSIFWAILRIYFYSVNAGFPKSGHIIIDQHLYRFDIELSLAVQIWYHTWPAKWWPFIACNMRGVVFESCGPIPWCKRVLCRLIPSCKLWYAWRVCVCVCLCVHVCDCVVCMCVCVKESW
jgi:hypothetical protein